MTKNEIEPRIYVACLACYNEGRLKGVWLDLEGKDKDALMEEITEKVLCGKGKLHEEWAIHDYELGGIKISEYEDLAKVCELAEVLIEHGEAFAVFVDYYGDGATKEDFEEAYCGQYDSEEDYAENLLEETGELKAIPENLRYYFDYEKYAHDLFINDFWMSDNGHVFRRI